MKEGPRRDSVRPNHFVSATVERAAEVEAESTFEALSVVCTDFPDERHVFDRTWIWLPVIIRRPVNSLYCGRGHSIRLQLKRPGQDLL